VLVREVTFDRKRIIVCWQSIISRGSIVQRRFQRQLVSTKTEGKTVHQYMASRQQTRQGEDVVCAMHHQIRPTPLFLPMSLCCKTLRHRGHSPAIAVGTTSLQVKADCCSTLLISEFVCRSCVSESNVIQIGHWAWFCFLERYQTELDSVYDINLF
jgi:hypothetical protein